MHLISYSLRYGIEITENVLQEGQEEDDLMFEAGTG
jgi:hypothetical protein